MKRLKLFTVILIILAILSGCAQKTSPDFQNISPGELFKMLQSEKNYLLVDVREPQELNETGFIPGAVNIPLGQVEKSLDRLPKSQKIILYCRSGRRSSEAARFLAGKGYTGVYNLEGGILAWPYEKTNN